MKYVTLHILLFYNSRKHTRNLLRESNSFHFKNNNTHTQDNKNIIFHAIKLKNGNVHRNFLSLL